MLQIVFVWIFLVLQAVATPPACFLACTNALASNCTHGHRDLSCLCRARDSLVGCLVDICPYGVFDSARDHYLGTCLEHKKEAPTAAKEAPKGTGQLNQGLSRSSTLRSGSASQPLQVPKEVQQNVQKFTSHKTPSTPAPAREKASRSKPLSLPQSELTRWEELQTTDDKGNIIIIRRPIKAGRVPKKAGLRENAPVQESARPSQDQDQAYAPAPYQHANQY